MILIKILLVRNAEAESNASITRVVDALISDNHEVIILSRSRSSNTTDEKIVTKQINLVDHIITTYEIQLPAKRNTGYKNIFNLLKYQRLVYSWLNDNIDKFDVIHCYDLDTGYVGKMISKKFNKKFVYHIADLYVDSRGGIPSKLKSHIRKLEYSVINKSDLTIVCTEQRMEQIKGSKPDKVVVIHNTPVVNVDNFDRKSDFNDKINNLNSKNKLIISYIGGLSSNRFINEMLELVSKNNNYILKIAGYGELEEKVKEYSRQYKNIIFYGKVDYKTSLEINMNSDLMIAMYNPKIKNNRYSAPNKVYESMYFMKPIIVSKNTGVDEIVTQENIGFVSAYDYDQLSYLLDWIYENQNKFHDLYENNYHTYEKYSWDKMKIRLIDAYNAL